MKLYRIFLPKQDQKGNEISSAKADKITRMIEKRFGAYSLNPLARLPLIQGAWTSKSTKKIQKEPMHVAELFLEDTFKNRRWVKAIKEMARQEFKQEEIFIISQEAEILT
jgi:hypothetical protein